MQPTPLPVISLPHQAWQLIEKDYILRLSLDAPQHAQEYQDDKRKLFYEARQKRNSGFLGPAWADLIIADADKRAEWAYAACLEIWQVQGRAKCRVLFHAIFQYAIDPIIGVRTGCFKSEIALYKTRTKKSFAQQDSAILGHLNRKIGQLRSKWSTKMEIATRDAEHQQRLAQIQVAQGAMINESEAITKATVNLKLQPSASGTESRLTWETLESRFNSIQVNAPSTDRVMVEYGWTAQNADPATSTFHLRGEAIFLSEFRSLANIAGQKLGCIGSEEECIKLWIDSVLSMVLRDGAAHYKQYIARLSGAGREHATEYSTEYYRSEHIAKLSALHCLEMQGKAMRQMNESATKPEQEVLSGGKYQVQDICLAEDKRSVSISGKQYHLSINQGKLIEVLIKAVHDRRDYVLKRELCKVLSPSSNPRDSFKRSPLWQTVIKSENDRYWLDLSSSVGNKKTATKRPSKDRKTTTKKIV